MRRERERAGLPTVALAGYTNAGKSTLLNALTGADVGVRERLFHTLDPTTRSFEIAGRSYLLTDTVGFIRKLPHQLVEAFAATLEEALGADLIVHVADASVPEEELHEMLAAVDDVLAEIGAGETPAAARAQQDRPARRRAPPRAVASASRDAVQVSGETGEGLDDAARGDRGALPRHAAADGAARALRARAARCPSCTTWPASWSARTPPRACACARGCRRRRRRASSASRLNGGPAGVTLRFRRLTRRRAPPAQAHDGDAGLRPARRRGRHARARRARASVGTGHRGGDPRGPRRPGAAALGPGGTPRHLASSTRPA